MDVHIVTRPSQLRLPQLDLLQPLTDTSAWHAPERVTPTTSWLFLTLFSFKDIASEPMAKSVVIYQKHFVT